MYGFDHGGWMFGGWVVMVLVWLIPFVVLFAGMKYLLGRSIPDAASKSALDILGQVKHGAVEIWDIGHPAMGLPHPMHTHGFLSR